MTRGHCAAFREPGPGGRDIRRPSRVQGIPQDVSGMLRDCPRWLRSGSVTTGVASVVRTNSGCSAVFVLTSSSPAVSPDSSGVIRDSPGQLRSRSVITGSLRDLWDNSGCSGMTWFSTGVVRGACGHCVVAWRPLGHSSGLAATMLVMRRWSTLLASSSVLSP